MLHIVEELGKLRGVIRRYKLARPALIESRIS
jgi:hypothetical protein